MATMTPLARQVLAAAVAGNVERFYGARNQLVWRAWLDGAWRTVDAAVQALLVAGLAEAPEGTGLYAPLAATPAGLAKPEQETAQ